MENFYFIGVDVSKKKLDICVMSDSKVVSEEQVSNHQQAIIKLLNELKRELNMTNENCLICAEHTGQYTYPLICACKSIGCKLWIENPTQIKYCSGMTRGKNDRVDAKRIAMYAFRFYDQAAYYKRPSEELVRLNQLEAERTLYKVDLSKYKAQVTDQKDFMPKTLYKSKSDRLKLLIRSLEQVLKKIEDEMSKIIETTKILSRQMDLLMSIDGVGRIVAMNMIIVTEAFTRFNNPRQFCCYAGVAPFAYTSGSSQHSKNKVSQKACKYIKTLLHMSAVAVIHRKDGELKAYYERKVDEGKNKMTIINALRAKLVARMFAVIKRDEFYSPILSKIIC